MVTGRIRSLIARTLGPLVFIFTLGRVEVDLTGGATSTGRADRPAITSQAGTVTPEAPDDPPPPDR